MRKYFVLLLPLAIMACTQAQMRQSQDQSRAEAAHAAREKCYDQAEATPAGAIAISILITSEGDPAAVTKMTINRPATNEERSAIIAYSQAVAPCRQIELAAAAEIDGGLYASVSRLYSRLDQAYAAIASGEVTISAGNRHITEVRSEARADINRAVEAYDANLRSEHDAEMVRRQAMFPPQQPYQGTVTPVGQSRSESSSRGLMCFHKGEQLSGMNKICYYDCAGSAAAKTVQSYELCPLNIYQ